MSFDIKKHILKQLENNGKCNTLFIYSSIPEGESVWKIQTVKNELQKLVSSGDVIKDGIWYAIPRSDDSQASLF